MQINSIGGYYIPKANFNKINTQSQIAFGKIKWENAEDIEKAKTKNEIRQTNNRISDFFYRMHNFETAANASAKYASDLAKKAYSKGKECDFCGQGETHIDNLPCRVIYSSNKNNYFITIEKSDDLWEFKYDKNNGAKPTEIIAVHRDRDDEYTLCVTSEKMKYEKENKENRGTIKRYAKYKDGCIYEEQNTGFMTQSCERGVVKGFKKIFQKSKGGNFDRNSTVTTYKQNPFTRKWELEKQ